MNAQRMTSDDLRRDWQRVVGSVRTGGTVVIEEANKAVAVVIPVEYFEALQEQIENLQDIRAAEAAIEEYRRDPSTAISWEEAKAILREDKPADGQ